MKFSRIYYPFFIFLLTVAFQANGQYVVKRTTGNTTNTTQDGFYYALPRTVLQIDLTLEHIKRIPGPLADYASDYLGVNDYIREKGDAIKLIDAEITQGFDADPEQFFYVQFPAERAKDEEPASFMLTDKGTLLAFGMKEENTGKTEMKETDQTIIMMEGDERFSYFADYNRTRKVDTIVRKISIDTVTINRFLYKTSWVDKSDKEKANEAAKKISEIREARFHLLSGYQEVNYGESIKYMDRQLMKLEQQYLELFIGKEVKTTEQVAIYYIPENGKLSDILYEDPAGNPVEISLEPGNTTTQLPEAPLEKQNNIYYRIPQSTVVNISQNGITYSSAHIPVCQFGVLATASLNRTRLLFNEQTGSLKNIIRE
jgi:hypothetical protein